MSRGDLLLLIAVLAAFGIVVSSYLTWQWYDAAVSSWCDLDDYFSCTKVRESPFAAVAGVPTALVGVAGFAILCALATVGLRGRARMGRWPIEAWLFAFAILGVLIGAALTLVEVFVIQAICILCVLGFGLALGILGASVLLSRSRSPVATSP